MSAANPVDEDRSLANAAQAMIAAAERSRSVVRVLQHLCPDVYHQLRRLHACHDVLSLWGRSSNVDAHAGAVIVHPAILHAIGEVAGHPLRGRVVHAGLEHTYGYLFSLIETPYGTKRERWTRPTIEKGFGIRTPTLRARPAAGTLLTNLTWFAGHVAFRDRPRELRRLKRSAAHVSPVVRQYPYDDLNVSRVVENVTIPRAVRPPRCVQLRTALVAFPCRTAATDAETHLLIYSALPGPSAPARLITAFPVTHDVVEALTAPEREGEVVLNGLPYNAYLPGLGGRTFAARRHVERAGG